MAISSLVGFSTKPSRDKLITQCKVCRKGIFEGKPKVWVTGVDSHITGYNHPEHFTPDVLANLTIE